MKPIEASLDLALVECCNIYIKLKEDFFRDETILLIEDVKDGFLFSNILLKMYLLSLKNEGQLLLSQGIAYTPQMIATLTNHQVGTVEQALQIFMQLRLVEELTDGTLFMTNIQTLIGKSSTEAERKHKERVKLKENSLLPSDKGGQMSALCPQMSENRPPEYRDKRLEYRDKRRESGKEVTSPALFYGQYQNVSLTDNDINKLKSELPSLYDKYIEKLSEYMASSSSQTALHSVLVNFGHPFHCVARPLSKKSRFFGSPI